MDDSGQLEKLDETEENPQHLCVRTKRLERGKDIHRGFDFVTVIGSRQPVRSHQYTSEGKGERKKARTHPDHVT